MRVLKSRSYFISRALSLRGYGSRFIDTSLREQRIDVPAFATGTQYINNPFEREEIAF